MNSYFVDFFTKVKNVFENFLNPSLKNIELVIGINLIIICLQLRYGPVTDSCREWLGFDTVKDIKLVFERVRLI